MPNHQPVLLLIDAGNTAVKWQLIDQSDSCARRVAASGQAVVHRLENTQVTAQKFSESLQETLGAQPLKAVAWVGVGPVEVEQAIHTALQGFPSASTAAAQKASDSFALKNAGPDLPLLVLHNRYREPSQLGPDRWASALGLAALGDIPPGDVHLIVSAGTATTLDLVRRISKTEFEFMGGWIFPGVGLMRSMLARHTRELQHSISSELLSTAVPQDSQTAISQGIAMAQTAMIEQLALRHQVKKIWVHGGDATFWLLAFRSFGQARISVQARPCLIFNGLAAMAGEDAAGSAPG